jgi:hypothetical protein
MTFAFHDSKVQEHFSYSNSRKPNVKSHMDLFHTQCAYDMHQRNGQDLKRPYVQLIIASNFEFL